MLREQGEQSGHVQAGKKWRSAKHANDGEGSRGQNPVVP